MNNKIIIALDFQNPMEIDKLLSELTGLCCYYKIGMEAFFSQGPALIEKIKKHNAKIFLDLKLHDIPNTVKKALKTLNDLEIEMINIHALGGKDMMSAAREVVSDKTQLLAVTLLTSHDNNFCQTYFESSLRSSEFINKLAQEAKECGLNGVVCSVNEVSSIKKICSPNFICVTPGIRPLNANFDDQKRVATPTQAIEAGSDYLVIGRTITHQPSPKESFLKIIEEINNA